VLCRCYCVVVGSCAVSVVMLLCCIVIVVTLLFVDTFCLFVVCRFISREHGVQPGSGRIQTYEKTW